MTLRVHAYSTDAATAMLAMLDRPTERWMEVADTKWSVATPLFDTHARHDAQRAHG